MMTNYPTILGAEPAASGTVPGDYPFIPRPLLDEVLRQQLVITLTQERLFRFPLVARIDSFRRGKYKLRSACYRWMLYALPYDSDLNRVEVELRRLNELRDERGEYRFPLLACDIASNHFHYPRLGGEDVTTAPVFVPAFRSFSL